MLIHILLVDDSPEILDILTDIYGERSDVRIVGTARTYDEAFKILNEQPVDMVSLDIRMGTFDGLDLCRMVRRRFPNVYIIMCSGESSPETKALAYTSGARDFIQKPFNVEDINRMLSDYYREMGV